MRGNNKKRKWAERPPDSVGGVRVWTDKVGVEDRGFEKLLKDWSKTLRPWENPIKNVRVAVPESKVRGRSIA